MLVESDANMLNSPTYSCPLLTGVTSYVRFFLAGQAQDGLKMEGRESLLHCEWNPGGAANGHRYIMSGILEVLPSVTTTKCSILS